MPPALAANFTTGEAAALAVIAREVQRSGQMRSLHRRDRRDGRRLPIDGPERDCGRPRALAS